MPNDFVQVENIEFEAQVDLYRAAPHDMRATYAVGISRVGSAICFTCRSFEPTAIFRRAAGLGVGRAIGEQELDEDVVAHMNARRLRYAVPVAMESLANSFALILAPGLADRIFPAIPVPALIGAASLCL